MNDLQDKLSAMFDLQAELNQRIGVDTTHLPDEQKAEWILNFCRALQQETAELIDSVPWKWWAKYQEMDIQNARVEIIDLFHFLISLAQCVDLSADQVFELYCAKHKVNHQRQDSGYSEKDETDNAGLTV